MFVTHEPPILGHGGSGNYLNMMIKFFRIKGHKVSLFIVDWGFLDTKIITEALDDLKKNGVEINFVSFKKKNFFNNVIKILYLIFKPSNIYFKQAKYIQNKLSKFHNKIKPDIFFLYCAQSLEWTKNIKDTKKFCPLIELPFLNSKLWLNFAINKRFQYKSLSKRLFAFINLYINYFSQKKIIRLYKNCDFKAHVSYDYYNFLKQKKIEKIKYYNHPVEDIKLEHKDMINKKLFKGNENNIKKKFKIIMVGKLSTITYLQYEYLQNEIIPEIVNNKFVKNNIEIRLIGSGKDNDFIKLYSYKFVNHLGYVNDFEKELIESDLYLCPSPQPLGSRSRLNEGMAYGCCISTSIFDQAADPNLISGLNCFISKTPKEYVEIIEKLIKNPSIKISVMQNAYKTYQSKFKKSIACSDYENDIISLL